MSSSGSGSSDRGSRGQVLVLAALILTVAFIGLTLISQDLANTGFEAVREEARSLVREYDNTKDRFGTALDHLSNHGNRSGNEVFLVDRGFDTLTANYTELEASRRTHLDADLIEVRTLADRRIEADVNLTFRDEFTEVNETVTFPFDLYLADAWWRTDWDFRVPVVVDSRLLEREDYGAELTLNLTKARERADDAGSIATDSIQVVEVTSSGSVIGNVTRGVRELPGFDASDDARVLVVFSVDGTTADRTKRYYHVYFDESVPDTPPTGVIEFEDSFEDADLDVGPEWSPTSRSTDDTHANLGNRSWKATGGHSITHTLSEEYPGVVTLWFHDRDPSSTNVDSWATVTVNNTDTGSSLDFALGMDQSVTSSNYTLEVDGDLQDTDFTREQGWHRFTFRLNSTHMDLYIDRKRVVTNETLAAYELQEIELSHGGGSTIDTWFDDVRVYRDVVLSRVHPMHRTVRWTHTSP